MLSSFFMKGKIMKVVGIDGSTNKTGVAVFENGKYITHVLIDLHKEKNAMVRIPKMIVNICDYISTIDDIDVIIMEKSISSVNIDTLQKLSNLAGGVMAYAYSRKCEFMHPVPSEWRKKIGIEQSNKIKREVLKQEAIEAVLREYGLVLSDDEAEAILVARSVFDLPKIIVKADEIEYWGISNED